MKLHRSPIVVLTLGITLLFPGAAFANEVIEMYEAGVNGYQVSLGFLTEIQTGENKVHVKILDPQEQPATPDEVEVMLMRVEESGHAETDSHSAPAAEPTSEHSGMSGMEMDSEPATESNHDASAEPHEDSALVALEAGHESGEYEGVLHFEKSGEWNVVVHFTVEEQPLEVAFPVTVARTFSKPGVLAGIFGLNVAIVLTAAALKSTKSRKSL